MVTRGLRAIVFALRMSSLSHLSIYLKVIEHCSKIRKGQSMKSDIKEICSLLINGSTVRFPACVIILVTMKFLRKCEPKNRNILIFF